MYVYACERIVIYVALCTDLSFVFSHTSLEWVTLTSVEIRTKIRPKAKTDSQKLQNAEVDIPSFEQLVAIKILIEA